MRKVHTKRYNKQVPGHHIQMDVKFLTFTGKRGEKIRRFQYTAIDDATRVRALKVYDKHTQANAIDFVDHIIKKFPFRIKEIRTDNGHEFQAKFHWHVEDQGIRHAYIKPRSPQLNGKVERVQATFEEAGLGVRLLSEVKGRAGESDATFEVRGSAGAFRRARAELMEMPEVKGVFRV